LLHTLIYFIEEKLTASLNKIRVSAFQKHLLFRLVLVFGACAFRALQGTIVTSI
jgi:hypothetical protein